MHAAEFAARRAPVFRETFKDLWRDAGFYSKPPPKNRAGRSCPTTTMACTTRQGPLAELRKRYAQRAGCVCVRHGIYWGKGSTATARTGRPRPNRHIFSYHVQLRKKKACAPLCLRPIAGRDVSSRRSGRGAPRWGGPQRKAGVRVSRNAGGDVAAEALQGGRDEAPVLRSLAALAARQGRSYDETRGLAATLAGREEPPTGGRSNATTSGLQWLATARGRRCGPAGRTLDWSF